MLCRYSRAQKCPHVPIDSGSERGCRSMAPGIVPSTYGIGVAEVLWNERRRIKEVMESSLQNIVTGNAAADSTGFRGWLIGDFIPRELGLRWTPAVEVKWGVHAIGETRSDWGVA